ncbi:MAG: hypothetical protein C4324_06080 [Blastocatellia bacterium]
MVNELLLGEASRPCLTLKLLGRNKNRFLHRRTEILLNFRRFRRQWIQLFARIFNSRRLSIKPPSSKLVIPIWTANVPQGDIFF